MKVLEVDDFFGNPLIICPYQFENCEYQFSCGDGAFCGCKCDECYETKICNKEFNK
jgi:hypothetical protein